MEEILSSIPPVIRYINRECFEQSRRTEIDYCGLSWNFLKELDGEKKLKMNVSLIKSRDIMRTTTKRLTNLYVCL